MRSKRRLASLCVEWKLTRLPEIAEHQTVVRIHQTVLRAHIEMRHAAHVTVRDGGDELIKEAPRVRERRAPPQSVKVLGEIAAFAVIKHEPVLFGVKTHFAHADNAVRYGRQQLQNACLAHWILLARSLAHQTPIRVLDSDTRACRQLFGALKRGIFQHN